MGSLGSLFCTDYGGPFFRRRRLKGNPFLVALLFIICVNIFIGGIFIYVVIYEGVF